MRVATECWIAIHRPSSSASAQRRGKRIERHRSSSISSADIPLAQTTSRSATKATRTTTLGRTRGSRSPSAVRKSRAKRVDRHFEGDTPEDRAKALIYPMHVDEKLEKEFRAMILEDEDMYIRILRYEVSLARPQSYPVRNFRPNRCSILLSPFRALISFSQ